MSPGRMGVSGRFGTPNSSDHWEAQDDANPTVVQTVRLIKSDAQVAHA